MPLHVQDKGWWLDLLRRIMTLKTWFLQRWRILSWGEQKKRKNDCLALQAWFHISANRWDRPHLMSAESGLEHFCKLNCQNCNVLKLLVMHVIMLEGRWQSLGRKQHFFFQTWMPVCMWRICSDSLGRISNAYLARSWTIQRCHTTWLSFLLLGHNIAELHTMQQANEHERFVGLIIVILEQKFRPWVKTETTQ